MEGNKIVIKENILISIKLMNEDKNHRYRSWDHCYKAFQDLFNSNSNERIDFATLHLSFFLASWGMYRGSSQLLQKDYRINTPIISELIRPEYRLLNSIDFDQIERNSKEVEIIYGLIKKLHSIYAQLKISPTNTLLTKVLLGTFCCIPAYDTYFIAGMDRWNRRIANESTKRVIKYFGPNSYISIVNFYRSNRLDFLEIKEYIKSHGFNYPLMKLIDMYFWNLGFLS